MIPSIPEICSDEKLLMMLRLINCAGLEESGQWLENVDQTHQVLASGNPVQQKTMNGLKACKHKAQSHLKPQVLPN